MKPKRAFLVLGPESSGNHLVTDLLVHAGCAGGSGDHVPWKPEQRRLGAGDAKPWDAAEGSDGQRWEVTPPTAEDPIVWRRSVPHGGEWLDLDPWVSELEARGYSVHGIVVTREHHANVQSQIKWRHAVDTDQAEQQIRRAYGEIFAQLANRGLPYRVVSYEGLVGSYAARAHLVEALDLRGGVDDFEVWDGNAKWYASKGAVEPAAVEGAGSSEPAIDTGFAEHWHPAAPHVSREYEKRVRIGREAMGSRRAVFCGLARDVERALPSVIGRIEKAGEDYAEYRAIVLENDSSDATPRILRDWAARNPRVDVRCDRLGAPRHGATRDPARMEQLAGYRNRLLDRVLELCPEFDDAVVMDLDLPRGFSYDGMATSYGYEGWDWMASNGIAAPIAPEPRAPLFFDAWAFRWPGDEGARPFEELNALRFHRGAPPVPVASAFGGLAIYKMAALRSGARYGGGDCEHVVFHRELAERGFGSGYLNPSQIVLYTDLKG